MAKQIPMVSSFKLNSQKNQFTRSIKFSVFILLLVSICGFSSNGFSIRTVTAETVPLRTYTATIHYAAHDSVRESNAVLALNQLALTVNSGKHDPYSDYSFNEDVLHNTLSGTHGYLNEGIGAGDAASLMDMLTHRAYFWDTDQREKPLFEVMAATPIKNDPVFGAYATWIELGRTDFQWRLNPAYSGPAPTISVDEDAEKDTVSLTVSYRDTGAAPMHWSACTQFAALQDTLQTMIGTKRLGVSIIDVDHPSLYLGVNAALQVPSASAWKGLGTVYFFEHVDPSIWQSIPVRYWNSKQLAELPPEYQTAWAKYGDLLRKAYVMTVFSGNHEAADVLAYVFRNLPADQRQHTNPIQYFNEWSQKVVGITPESGMYNWQYGDLMSPGIVDERFAKRRMDVNGVSLFINNTFSARDFAQIYFYLATQGKTLGYYDAAVALLSIRTPIISKIEGHLLPSMAGSERVQTASKDGYFNPGSENSMGHDVNNDAGLLLMVDGRRFAVAFTAFDSVALESDVIGVVLHNLVDSPAPIDTHECSINR